VSAAATERSCPGAVVSRKLNWVLEVTTIRLGKLAGLKASGLIASAWA
jgi:hypothetical protein